MTDQGPPDHNPDEAAAGGGTGALGHLVELPEGTLPVAEPLALPGIDQGIRGLFRDNLFKDVKNTVLTIIFGSLLVWLTWKAIGFVFFNTKVTPDGTTRSAWDVVREGPLIIYMVGNRFGQTGVGFEMVWAAVYTVMLTLGLGLGVATVRDAPPIRLRTRLGIIVPPVVGVGLILSLTQTILPTVLTVVGVGVLFAGRFAGMRLPMAVRRRQGLVFAGLLGLAFLLVTGFEPSNVNRFGGLLLTVVVAFTGIVCSFPIGVVMALARRSSFPLIRPLAVIYIELIRGVPLISLLFMGEFAIRFLFPPGMAVPGSVPRAIIMISLFSGAYVAEIVRGGLQSVPSGQTEAAQAIGLPPIKTTALVVLPQALRNSIPALVGQFLSLLKDTSLLSLIGLFDLLGVVGFPLGSLQFANQNFTPEAYAFVGMVYWIICFSLSRASQRLETRLGVGIR
jgi:general L-amino acid transport system permease protein